MSQKNEIKLSLFGHEKKVDVSQEGANRDLLVVIDALLTQEGVEKESLRGIMVVVGAGGFTSTRLAVTVANTFAYALQIPLLAIREDRAGDVQSLIDELEKQTPGEYISATYSGDPNINIKK